MSVDVLTLSSKGQIVLPAAVRKALSLVSGDKLALYSSGDAILLKPLRLPSEAQFEVWMDEAQEWAASVGYSEDDVEDVIKSVRNRKRQ